MSASKTGRSQRPRLSRAWIGVIFMACGSVVLAAALTSVVVGVPELQIRSSKTGFGKPLGVAKEKETLEVVAEEGDWLKVRYGGQEGYVKRQALTARSLAPAPEFIAKGGAISSGSEASLATRGLEPAALEYSRQKNLKTDGVETMIGTHLRITPQDFEAFEKEGLVGSFKVQ